MKTELKANKGKYKVVMVDTFSHEDWTKGEYDIIKEAFENCKGGEMLKSYVYDDKGKCLKSSGTY